MGVSVREMPGLRAAFMDSERIRPLVQREITVAGFDVDWQLGHPGAMHPHHLAANDFDVFEFSLAAYLVAQAGPRSADLAARLAWRALPVFLAKALLPLELHVHVGAGIRDWSDLHGRRVGVPDAFMTAAVWLRVMLRELYGIGPDDITWVNGRPATGRQSTLAGFSTPGRLRTAEIPPGADLGGLLAAGEIDAAFGDLTRIRVDESPTVRKLLDPVAGRQAYADFARRTGFVPMNHVVVVQRGRLAEYPPLAGALVDAFEKAKGRAYELARQHAGGLLVFPAAAIAGEAEVLGDDPYPSGLAVNRSALQMLAEQLHLEGQLADDVDVATLFLDVAGGDDGARELEEGW